MCVERAGVRRITSARDRLLHVSADYAFTASSAFFDADGWNLNANPVDVVDTESPADLMVRHQSLAAAAGAWLDLRRCILECHWQIVQQSTCFAKAWASFGLTRFTLYEAACLHKIYDWALTCVVQVQHLMLHSVGHFTPQMGQTGRRLFCRSIARALCIICANP